MLGELDIFRLDGSDYLQRRHKEARGVWMAFEGAFGRTAGSTVGCGWLLWTDQSQSLLPPARVVAPKMRVSVAVVSQVRVRLVCN